MKVRCEQVEVEALALSPAAEARVRGWLHLPRLSLDRGREYTVYAVRDEPTLSWVYLLEEARDAYPKPYAAPFFSVVDPRGSARWVEVPLADGRLRAPAVWAADPSFYERLIDGDPAAVEAFREERAAMDLEYEPAVEREPALDLGEGWVQCPRCGEAWEATSRGAPLKCTNRDCEAPLRDPR